MLFSRWCSTTDKLTVLLKENCSNLFSTRSCLHESCLLVSQSEIGRRVPSGRSNHARCLSRQESSPTRIPKNVIVDMTIQNSHRFCVTFSLEFWRLYIFNIHFGHDAASRKTKTQPNEPINQRRVQQHNHSKARRS